MSFTNFIRQVSFGRIHQPFLEKLYIISNFPKTLNHRIKWIWSKKSLDICEKITTNTKKFKLSRRILNIRWKADDDFIKVSFKYNNSLKHVKSCCYMATSKPWVRILTTHSAKYSGIWITDIQIMEIFIKQTLRCSLLKGSVFRCPLSISGHLNNRRFCPLFRSSYE